MYKVLLMPFEGIDFWVNIIIPDDAPLPRYIVVSNKLFEKYKKVNSYHWYKEVQDICNLVFMCEQ